LIGQSPLAEPAPASIAVAEPCAGKPEVKGCAMKDEALKEAVGRFMKKVSGTVQREMEKAIRSAVASDQQADGSASLKRCEIERPRSKGRGFFHSRSRSSIMLMNSAFCMASRAACALPPLAACSNAPAAVCHSFLDVKPAGSASMYARESASVSIGFPFFG